MTDETILLVEDDEELAELISNYLSDNAFTVAVESNGARAVGRIINEKPDLVILDLMLPGKDGISICREARFGFSGPILMLTASMDAVDQILGLEIGADDFVQKPVEPRVLLARIRALLRRTDNTPIQHSLNQSEPDLMNFGDLSINISARTVHFKGSSLEFSGSEYNVLLYLAENAGSIVSRDELFQSLRNLEYDGQSRFIDITISQIRKKLGGDADSYLKTVRGKGYLFAINS
jgi:two-component system response regulator RstA